MKRFLTICVYLVIAMGMPGVASVSLAPDSLSIVNPSIQTAEPGTGLSSTFEQDLPVIEPEALNTQPPLTISDGGRMNLVSGQTIVLRPGTRVLAGGYLRAAINSGSADQQAVKHSRKSKKHSKEETSVEPVILAASPAGISPFAKKTARTISGSNRDEEGFDALITDASGISQVQNNRKSYGYSIYTVNFIRYKIGNLRQNRFIANSERCETTSVLRL